MANEHHDEWQSAFEHVQASLSAFSESARKRLDSAFENGEPSSVKEQHVDERSQSFSQWHRTLAPWYTMIDIDRVYPYKDSGEVYLCVETICVPDDALDEEVPEQYPLWPTKRDAYLWLADSTGTPVYVCWHTDQCDRFFVREVDDSGEPRELIGDQGYMDWLDEFRLSSSDGDGDE